MGAELGRSDTAAAPGPRLPVLGLPPAGVILLTLAYWALTKLETVFRRWERERITTAHQQLNTQGQPRRETR